MKIGKQISNINKNKSRDFKSLISQKFRYHQDNQEYKLLGIVKQNKSF
jgi:hypothetical protein